MTYYDDLGVSPTATKQEIKGAYRDRAKAYQVEGGFANGKSATDEWIRVQDVDNKFAYDRKLEAEVKVSKQNISEN